MRASSKLYFCLLLVGLTRSLGAQDTNRAGATRLSARSLGGRLLGIFDGASGLPLEGVQVEDVLGIYVDSALADSVRSARHTFRTKSSGIVALGGVVTQHDSALIRIRKIGFRDTALFVQLRPSDTLAVTIALQPVAPTLPGVTTTALRRSLSMQGFEERRNDRSLTGKFVTPEQLRTKWDGLTLNEVYAGNGMVPMARGASSLRNRGCRVLYYLNGAPISGFDARREFADSYEAIEFYPSKLTAPPRFVASFAADVCGIFVLWLRGSH